MIALVADDSPLKIRIPGDTDDTPAQYGNVDLPALTIEDTVWVDYDADQRVYVVLAKLEAL